MNLPPTVAIVGLGLMGGSLARDLAAAGTRVLAHDPRDEVARAARAAGVVNELLDSTLRGASAADLVVLAVPVDAAADILTRLSGVLDWPIPITDVGSTKAAIADHAESLGLGAVFVGSHPLAGDHRSGWAASRPALYRGATVFVCPGRSASAAAASAVRGLWEAIGSVCVEVDPAEHDRRMAWLSHLPQVAASAVATTLLEAGIAADQLGPGGRDVTRLAGSSPEMWRAIALANAEPLRQAIERLTEQLEILANALRTADSDAIDTFFRRARDWRDPS
ncbi:MAG: prephenate dehydrogenase/arogenate dehydrogenase family protein [Gemmatimonadota bacterium]